MTQKNKMFGIDQRLQQTVTLVDYSLLNTAGEVLLGKCEKRLNILHHTVSGDDGV